VNGERLPVDRRVLVLGRGQDCDVRLSDPNVSRRHAELRQEETSYWIVDLGSTNGLEVNGRRLRQAKLEGGDRITLGSTDVVFERELQ
jgi:pSer/pThr/pTyr-binding forkhead associated (FHA) protein